MYGPATRIVCALIVCHSDMYGSNMPTQADRKEWKNACAVAQEKAKALSNVLERSLTSMKARVLDLLDTKSKCKDFTAQAGSVLNQCLAVNLCQRAHLCDQERQISEEIRSLQVIVDTAKFTCHSKCHCEVYTS
jgi:hypothetical protein